ncbi:MAG: DUF3299 domain-containing protein [Planctomycetota bacterium]|nr:MAG: DUF3299 domain-containing protein [Planctomycetota bacterium]
MLIVVSVLSGGTLITGCDTMPTPIAKETTLSPGLPDQPSVTPPDQVTAAMPIAKQKSPLGKAQEITFDDIKFEMQKGDLFTRDLLPKRVTSLESQRIRIRGYILPSFQQSGLTQFVLVRDNMECCFGPGAALYDCIVVRMLPGKTASFSIRPVAVSGIFRVEELRGPDQTHLAIYTLDGEDVQ